MGVDFNEEFFQRLSRSPQIVALVTAKAEKIAADARASAPVDTGAYRDGIHVELKFQKRAVAVVKSSDPKTLLIESRTGNLVRALQKNKRRG